MGIDSDWTKISTEMFKYEAAHEVSKTSRPARSATPSPGPTPAVPVPAAVKQNELGAKAVKVNVVVDVGAVLTLQVPAGATHVATMVRTPDLALAVKLTAKAIRKAQQAIKVCGGPETVVALIQGRLGPAGEILEAGIAAQPRRVPPVQVAQADVPAPAEGDHP
jgi:hypothetical protein